MTFILYMHPLLPSINYIHPASIISNLFTLLSMPPLYILLGLLLFSSLHTPSCSSATTNDTLMAGQALAVGDKLISRNGKFALGFFQPAASITSKSDSTISPNSNWYLGIWFNNIPVFTIVWVANRNKPITDPKINLTRLKISSDGNLVVIDNSGSESLIWSTHIANRTQPSINTTSVVLLNTGNLALIESPSHVQLWQSFDYPADVVLPGGKLGRNKVTGLNRQPISKKSLIDMGLGSYNIELGTSQIVLQCSNPSVEYWTWPLGISSSKLITILNSFLEIKPQTRGLIDIEYVDNDEEVYYMYTSRDDTSSVFVSLDISGQIKLNIWSQAKQSWQTIYAEPADSCTPPATCGPFTVCNGKARPSCDCMKSFSQKSPHDWEFDDQTGGCIRDTPLHCIVNGNTTSSTDMFHPIAQVQLPNFPQSIDVVTTQRKCEEACLNSCSCTAYSYNNNRCSVWHGELFSVNLNDGIDNTSEDVLYLRLAAKDLPSRSLPDGEQVQRRVGDDSEGTASGDWQLPEKGGATSTQVPSIASLDGVIAPPSAGPLNILDGASAANGRLTLRPRVDPSSTAEHRRNKSRRGMSVL